MIEIGVKCTICSIDLGIEETFHFGRLTINVEPCPNCFEAEYKRGIDDCDTTQAYDDGFVAGQASITDDGK